MPHKRNPVLTENLTGLARVIRGAAVPALENITLWHERDISHSSVERTTLPDAIMACDFALERLQMVVEQLVIYPERMRENMDSLGGLIYSQKVLLALTQAGMNREEAYKIVQEISMNVWESGCKESFLEQLRNDTRINAVIQDDNLVELFNPQGYLTHISELVDRALESS